VLLKPLSKAIEDNDNILSIIRSTVATSVGALGPTNMPAPDAVTAAVRTNILKSKVHPRTISYVETAAAGLPLGDAIEVSATSRAFREFTEELQYCALGTVKGNIGHAMAASGVSQLIKVILQLRRGQLLPIYMPTAPSGDLELGRSTFYLQQTLAPWERPVVAMDGADEECPRRALVNSLGAGGFYAGAIVEEYCS
jgi:acyl transferase domain-containing protein